MNETLSYITHVAGIVTIVWFVGDVRKQNSKVLKSILDVQKTQSEILERIQKSVEMIARLVAKSEKQ